MKTKMTIRLAMALVLAPLAALNVGCGRETRVYPDPVVKAESDPPLITVDGRSVLPKGFLDQSVNGGLADIALDESTSSSIVLRLSTLPASNLEGGFNGPGVGNRAILGIIGYHQRQLSEIASVTFDAKGAASDDLASVLLQVDLNCDGKILNVLTAEGTDLDSETSPTLNYTRFTAALARPIWSALDAAIMSKDSSTELVPAASGGTRSSLSALLTAYPGACLRNGFAGAKALPNGIPMAAVMLSLGDQSNTDMKTVFLNRVTVGSTVYAGWE